MVTMLQKADHDLVVHDLSLQAAEDALAAGEDGLIAGLAGGKVWVDSSTNDVRVVLKLHEALGNKKAYFLNAVKSRT